MEAVNTLAALFASVVDWIGDVVEVFISNPIFLIGVAIFLVGACIGLVNRLLGR